MPPPGASYAAGHIDIPIQGAPSGIMAISYDATRDAFWAVGGDGLSIYLLSKTTGVATLRFAIDPSTGALTSVGWEPTQGKTPRFFGLDPSGTHLYAANQISDTVVIFRVNQVTGKLTPTSEVIKVASPCTMAFR